MWHIIYLGLLNVLVGVSSSVAVRHRAKWVQQQLDDGYDFQRTFPPRFSDRLPLIRSKAVDMSQLCKAIDPNFVYQPEEILLESVNSKQQTAEWNEVDIAANQPSGSKEIAGEVPKQGTLPALEVVENNSNVDSAIETEVENSDRDSHTMEVIDLQSSDVSGLELLEGSENDGKSELSVETAEMQSAKPAVASAGMESTDEQAPQESHVKQTVAVDAKEESHDDLMQRFRKIERTLQGLIDESCDSQVAIDESSAQVLDAAKYWETFRDSAKEVLTSPQRCGKEIGAVDSLDMIVEQVNRDVTSCCEIAQNAVAGLDPASSVVNLRTQVLQAAAGSHQLRDQMAMSVETDHLPFENCTPIGLPDYYEGLIGLNEVIQDWLQQNDSSIAAGIGLIDLDNFTQINKDHGLTLGDQVLANCCEQICRLVRHNRGYDRLVRVGGQQFLLFFGFTKGRDVCFALERIRQSFVQTDFEIRDELTHIDIRAAAIPFDGNQSPLKHLQRLREGLAQAKAAGGNRVVYGEFELDFDMVDGLPEYDLPIKSIEVKSQCVVNQ